MLKLRTVVLLRSYIGVFLFGAFKDFQNGHICRQERQLTTTQLSHISAEDFQLGTFISLSTLSHLFLQHTMTLCRRRMRPVPMIFTLSKTMLRRRRLASSREVCYDSALDWLIALLVIPRVSHAS